MSRYKETLHGMFLRQPQSLESYGEYRDCMTDEQIDQWASAARCYAAWTLGALIFAIAVIGFGALVYFGGWHG